MRLLDRLRRLVYQVMYTYQKLQYMVLSVVVAGIVDYFFLYELSVTFMASMPLLALELIPLGVIVLTLILAWRAYRYIRRKMKENKHYLLL